MRRCSRWPAPGLLVRAPIRDGIKKHIAQLCVCMGGAAVVELHQPSLSCLELRPLLHPLPCARSLAPFVATRCDPLPFNNSIIQM